MSQGGGYILIQSDAVARRGDARDEAPRRDQRRVQAGGQEGRSIIIISFGLEYKQIPSIPVYFYIFGSNSESNTNNINSSVR